MKHEGRNEESVWQRTTLWAKWKFTHSAVQRCYYHYYYSHPPPTCSAKLSCQRLPVQSELVKQVTSLLNPSLVTALQKLQPPLAYWQSCSCERPLIHRTQHQQGYLRLSELQDFAGVAQNRLLNVHPLLWQGSWKVVNIPQEGNNEELGRGKEVNFF